MTRQSKGKERRTVNVDSAVWERIEERVPQSDKSGAKGLVSAKVESDLRRYQSLIDHGQKELRESFSVSEILYLVDKGYGLLGDMRLEFWMDSGLASLAHNTFAGDDDGNAFGVDSFELRKRIESMSVLPKLALLEFLEQTCLIPFEEIKEHVRKHFGGNDAEQHSDSGGCGAEE